MKLLIEANNILSLITGSAKDLAGMKNRVKRGYEGEYTDHVHAYDEYGFHLQDRSARIQLEHLSFDNMNVLDVAVERVRLVMSQLNKVRNLSCVEIFHIQC